MTLRVDVNSDFFAWACDRAKLDPITLTRRFAKFPDWESGEAKPTLKQLEAFANATHTPIGFFFLPEPPHEEIPVPDLRTIADKKIAEPSADLLDTVYMCQQRQEWYRDYALKNHEKTCDFVNSVSEKSDINQVAQNMRETLRFSMNERLELSSWTEALRRFIDQADQRGVLVMVSGVVGTNNRRKLKPEEFRGFALCDPYAPLVFINGADSKAAQMFTLAHELAHLWFGQSALSDVGVNKPSHHVEKWCNAVAAEFLVPQKDLRTVYQKNVDLKNEVKRLAKFFKVSTLVVLRRLRDSHLIDDEVFNDYYFRELARLKKNAQKGKGGDFYLTQSVRTSKRFARAIISSTYEGQNSFTEAFRLLGVKKTETLHRFGSELGVLT